MTKRFALKAAILAAVAAGFVCALSAAASAKVVDPGSAYQPNTVGLAKMAGVESVPAASTAPVPAASATPQIKNAEPATATPAPEPVVERVAPQLVSTSVVPQQSSPLQRAVRPLRHAVQRFGSYLERVVSSCPVGPVSATGGPVIALGILCFGLALNRRWVLAAQPATDESVPEFLFAWELTPPG